MLDIKFDIETRDIVMDGDDFAVTVNPSTQNGGILELSRCAFLSSPMLGVGIQELINSPVSKAAYELNRWQDMAKKDGASIARWENKNGKLNTFISYE